jgi:D-glycero-D-manno-heptose 1,7-bisphosphate phosphatase
MRGRALFLDRDGIINQDLGHVHRPADFIFQPGIFALCQGAQALGFGLVVVTNQAGIGRGYYTEAQFHELTRWMLDEFRAQGISFVGVEFCPDHPVHGVGRYRRENVRRKPGPGMILDACAAHGLDPARSAMLGDRASDMQAALAAGVGTRLLLPANAAEIVAAPPGTRVIAEGGPAAALRFLPVQAATE